MTRRCRPSDVNLLQARMSQFIDNVWSLTRSNRLQLNPEKTEFVWCTPSRRRHRNSTSDVLVCNDPIHPVQSVRDLGVYVDWAMTMRTHINHVLSSCFSSLRQIKFIKRSLLAHALTTLVTALVHSRLDYCNVVFAGLPTATFSACSAFSTRPFVWSPTRPGGTTSLVCFAIIIGFLSSSVLSTSCAWLFVVACTAKHHVIWPTSSRRLPQLLPKQVSDPPHLALSQCHVPRHHSVTARSLWPLRARGTSCLRHFVALTLLTLSNANWQFYLPGLFSFWILDFAYC